MIEVPKQEKVLGEVLSATVGSIRFDSYGAVFIIRTGKTGGRRVRIVWSARALAEWLNHHPRNRDHSTPLWTSLAETGSVKRAEYNAIRKMLREAAARSHITKRVNPGSFRIARATSLADDLTDAQMKEYLGWTADSRMPAVYVHMSGRNVDNAILKLNGLKKEQEVDREEHPLKFRICKKCQETNSPTGRFCARCGAPLDLKVSIELDREDRNMDSMMDILFDDPDFETYVETALKNRLRTILSKKEFSGLSVGKRELGH